jgi:transposase
VYPVAYGRPRTEAVGSVQRRPRWTAEEKERLVESLEPGTGVSAVARQAGIHASQLYGWRPQVCGLLQPAANFAAVRIAAEPAPNGMPASGTIGVEFANGFYESRDPLILRFGSGSVSVLGRVLLGR